MTQYTYANSPNLTNHTNTRTRWCRHSQHLWHQTSPQNIHLRPGKQSQIWHFRRLTSYSCTFTLRNQCNSQFFYSSLPLMTYSPSETIDHSSTPSGPRSRPVTPLRIWVPSVNYLDGKQTAHPIISQSADLHSLHTSSNCSTWTPALQASPP